MQRPFVLIFSVVQITCLLMNWPVGLAVAIFAQAFLAILPIIMSD